MGNSSKKNVLLLRSGVGVFGAERVVLELAKGLMDTEYHPFVGVIQNQDPNSTELAKAAEREGVPAIVFECGGAFDVGTIRTIREFIADNQICLINPHGYKANFYGLAAAGVGKLPSLATIHPWTETEYSFRAKIYTFLDKTWLRLVDELVAVSENVQEILQKMLPQKQCTLISNGIDVQRFQQVTPEQRLQYRKQLGVAENDLLIGTIGRLVPEKGYQYFIESAAALSQELPNIKFAIIGDGELREDLVSQTRKKNISERMQFLGVRNDIPELIAAMDAYVLSSVSEGLPMVVLEAMAAGKPVIATSVGDVPKIIAHRKTGLLIESGDIAALTAAIRELAENPQIATLMGENARNFVEQYYSLAHMTSKYVERFDALISERMTDV
ncbi:MAG: glycosyltransferase family 4 protein [Calditrichae bacterium]|nr:glycosyltransferase family 4 protein [Calditrichia bacterium]